MEDGVGASDPGNVGTLRDDQKWFIGSFATVFPCPAILRNFDCSRRLFAQDGKHGEDGVGASEPGGVGTILNDQTWLLEAQADGTYVIKNAFSQRRLFAQTGKSMEDGVGACVGTLNDDQKWYLEAQPDGSYVIRNAFSHRTLFAQDGKRWEEGVGAGTKGGTLWDDQKWYIVAP